MTGLTTLKITVFAEELLGDIFRVEPKVARVGTHHVARVAFQRHMVKIPNLQGFEDGWTYA
jgi:hypothetical protein